VAGASKDGAAELVGFRSGCDGNQQRLYQVSHQSAQPFSNWNKRTTNKTRVKENRRRNTTRARLIDFLWKYRVSVKEARQLHHPLVVLRVLIPHIGRPMSEQQQQIGHLYDQSLRVMYR